MVEEGNSLPLAWLPSLLKVATPRCYGPKNDRVSLRGEPVPSLWGWAGRWQSKSRSPCVNFRRARSGVVSVRRRIGGRGCDRSKRESQQEVQSVDRGWEGERSEGGERQSARRKAAARRRVETCPEKKGQIGGARGFLQRLTAFLPSTRSPHLYSVLARPDHQPDGPTAVVVLV